MTPSLASVYDALVAFVADPSFVGAAEVAAARGAFEKRVGTFAPSDPWFEERSAALWDRVLTLPAVLDAVAEARPASFGRDHLAALTALRRAQRGLFEVHASRDGVDLVCVVRGAAFRMAPADDTVKGLVPRAVATGADDDVSPGLLDARVVPTAEGVALLPGLLSHPAEATEAVASVLARARTMEKANDDIFDALLAMRHKLASLSRMKAKQVYRPEALGS